MFISFYLLCLFLVKTEKLARKKGKERKRQCKMCLTNEQNPQKPFYETHFHNIRKFTIFLNLIKKIIIHNSLQYSFEVL